MFPLEHIVLQCVCLTHIDFTNRSMSITDRLSIASCTISALGTLLTAVIASIYYKNRSSPIVKASGTFVSAFTVVLSYILVEN